jgi:hypothetical protein
MRIDADLDYGTNNLGDEWYHNFTYVWKLRASRTSDVCMTFSVGERGDKNYYKVLGQSNRNMELPVTEI